MQTVREQIIAVLLDHKQCARDISQSLGISQKDVYAHLPHVSRTLKSRHKRLVVLPFNCLKCGYAFVRRNRYSPPGRCPQCKAGHIEPPNYEIVSSF